MVISHRHRYLYFVVPKCASATVRQSLAPYTDLGYPVTEYPQHLPIHRFLGTEYAHTFGDYFKFTFVRNPYDRLYSGYIQDRFACENYARWTKAKKEIFDIVGDDFNRYMLEYVAKADVLNNRWWICFCPMTSFSHHQGQYSLDWFGRAEHIEKDLTALAIRLDVSIAKADDVNVRVQPTAGLKYLSNYNRATIELVNELYKDDFEFFGYTPINPSSVPVSAD